MKKEMITIGIISIFLGFIFLFGSCEKQVIEQAPCECNVDSVKQLDTMSLPRMELDSIEFTLKNTY